MGGLFDVDFRPGEKCHSLESVNIMRPCSGVGILDDMKSVHFVFGLTHEGASEISEVLVGVGGRLISVGRAWIRLLEVRD